MQICSRGQPSRLAAEGGGPGQSRDLVFVRCRLNGLGSLCGGVYFRLALDLLGVGAGGEHGNLLIPVIQENLQRCFQEVIARGEGYPQSGGGHVPANFVECCVVCHDQGAFYSIPEMCCNLCANTIGASGARTDVWCPV